MKNLLKMITFIDANSLEYFGVIGPLRVLNPPHGKRGGGGPIKKLRILPYAKFAR
jgi:hypothetical protein